MIIMKLIKNITLAVMASSMAFILSSCNGNEVEGKGDATVGFAKSSYTYKESAGLVKLPVEFTGEPKQYPITFSVSVKSDDPEIALDTLVHFTQTESLKYVGNKMAPVFIEFQIFDNKYINDSRFITLTLTDISGATAANATTVVEIADNDNNPYERLWGNWTLTGKSLSDDSAASFDVNISGGFTDEEVEANADKVLVCWGYAGYMEDYTGQIVPGHQPVWYMDYDGETASLSVQVGTLLANIFSFGIDGYSDFELKTASLLVSDDDADFSEKIQIPAKFSADCNTITFQPDYGLCAIIYGDGTYTKYYWKGFYGIVMTRK